MRNGSRKDRGWVLYDETCRICRHGAAQFGPMLQRRGFRLAPLQSEVGRRHAVDGKDEMKVVTSNGRIFGGAEAIAFLSGHIWWAKPLGWLWRAGPMSRAGTAAVLSLVVPGVGQIYNGDFLRGIFWLIVTPGFWIGSGGLLGWVCHLIAAYTAYNRAEYKRIAATA